jgi:predicted DNA-binding transcriptional regulator YafY
MFPTQEIEAERPDGSFVVSFRVGRYEAIRNILKSWIPHIVVLSPKDLRTSLTADIKEWLNRQNIEH